MRNLAGAYLLVGLSQAIGQATALPAFGPQAVPLLHKPDYLRQSPEADFWRLAAFYVPQATTSDCSLTSTAMAVNALGGLIESLTDKIVTREALLSAVASPAWAAQVAENGCGVTFDELQAYLRQSFDRADLADASIHAVAPDAADEPALGAFRDALIENEASADSLMLVYYNQAMVTGDDDGGPHVSPVGAYDPTTDRVLIMDVDRDFHVPYWTSTETLLAALVEPAAEDHGVLAGETGGYILARKA